MFIFKSRLKFIILSILLLACVNSISAEYVVKTIYFKPNNVNNIPFEKIRKIMEDVQELYKNEMSRNGYGNQTFKLERDRNNNVKVNIVNGNHASGVYKTNTWDKLKSELNENWKNYQKNIHVFIIGGIDIINSQNGCCQWGVGWPIYDFNFGGSCIVAENANTSLVRLIAHEIGHAFSLYHTGAENALMGSGNKLLEYEARWLHKHYFFNTNRIIKWEHPKVNQIFNVEEIERNIISIKANITSSNNLHQVVVMDSSILVIGWQYITDNSRNVDIRIDRSKLIGKNQIIFMVMDTFGAFTHQNFNYIMPLRFKEPIIEHKPTKLNKNEDLDIVEELEPITIKKDTSKNVVYLNINLGKKTLPDENGLKPFNRSHEYKNGWGWRSISDNKTNNGNSIIIRNVTFEKGISLSPPERPRVSSLKYNLQGNNYIAFEGYIGITNDRITEIGKHENKSCFVGGSSIFTFKIDDKEIYKSKLLTGNDNHENIDFYIPFDAEMLEIIIDSGNDSEWCDHPAIGDPKLISNSEVRYSINPKDKVPILWGKIKRDN